MKTGVYVKIYPMNETERTAWVIDRLGSAANYDDVIFELCRIEGWDWSRAQAYVERVTQVEMADILRHKSPALLVLSLGALGIGLAWSGIAYYMLFQPLLKNIHEPLTFNLILQSALSTPLLIPQIIAGMGLGVGGLIGVVNTLQGISS